MSKYYLGSDGHVYSEEELYHYGVPGMKWGVRKSDYKSMSRAQRKTLQKQHFDTDQGKADLKRITRNTMIGSFIGGPIGGAIAGFSTLKKISESVPNSKTITTAKSVVSKNADKKVSDLTGKTSTKTESKRVASIKSRVTGKKENGKPVFLMSEEEMVDFNNKYETRRRAVLKQYRNSSDAKTKQKLLRQLDDMENDYLSVVEQDFWYADD